MTRLRLLALAALNLVARRSEAQPLFARAPVGRLEPVRTTYDPEVVAAIDDAGRVLTRSRMGGELRCHDPGAGAGAGRIVANISGAIAVAADQRNFLALVSSAGSDTVRVARGSCGGGTVRELTVHAPGERLVSRATRESVFALTGDGQGCFSGDDAVWCFDANGATSPVTPQRRARFADLDAALHPERFAPAQRWLAAPPPANPWSVFALTFGPGDRLFALVQRTWVSPGQDIAAKWVVELPASGPVRSVVGPADASIYPRPGPRPLAPSLLADATTLLWVPSLGMLAAETRRMEPVSWTEPEAMVGTGLGLALMRPDDGAAGYLSLSELYAENSRCAVAGPGTQLRCLTSAFTPTHDGALLWTLDGATAPTEQPLVTSRLTLDPAQFDLDGDRVRAEDERRAGASDLRVDSDQGGALDAVEILAGNDPGDPSDDPRVGVTTPRDQLFFAQSSFVRSVWTERALLVGGQTPVAFGREGPLCNSDGNCYDRSGAVVGGFAPSTLNVRSVDGRAVVTLVNDAFVRTEIATGRRDVVATAVSLGALLRTPVTRLTCIPVDGDDTWLWAPDEGRLVIARRGRAPELRYDHAAARCDSGLCAGRIPFAPCTGTECAILRLPNHDVRGEPSLTGYLAERREVTLSVSGNWESYVVGVGASTAPRVLARMHAAFLPALLHPIATGRYLTSGVRPFAPFNNTVVDAWLRPTPSGGSTFPFTRLHSAFSDTHLLNVCCGSRDDGLWEVIPADASLRPGDGVVLLGGDDGAGLWKLPRRGGAVEVQRIRELRSPTGLDVHRDGRICAADPSLHTVIELLPDEDGGSYRAATRALLDIEAVDCVYGDDGAIHALVRGEPSRVVIWSPDRARFTSRDASGAASRAWQLDLRGPDNYYVTPAEGGGSPHHASSRVRVDLASSRLWVDNNPVGPALVDPQNVGRPTRFHVAMREDGHALVSPAFAYNQPADLTGVAAVQVIRLRDGDRQEFARWQQVFASSIAMGVRPGGAATSPWTGDAEVSRAPVGAVPTAPPRLAGGTREPVVPRACAVGASPNGGVARVAWVVLVLGWTTRVRRRARWSRRPRRLKAA